MIRVTTIEYRSSVWQLIVFGVAILDWNLNSADTLYFGDEGFENPLNTVQCSGESFFFSS